MTSDILDIAITKGVPPNKIPTSDVLELLSDHTPVLHNPTNQAECHKNRPSLSNHHTNRSLFHSELEGRINFKIPLKTPTDIETAMKKLTIDIQEFAWTPAEPPFTLHSLSNFFSPKIKESHFGIDVAVEEAFFSKTK